MCPSQRMEDRALVAEACADGAYPAWHNPGKGVRVHLTTFAAGESGSSKLTCPIRNTGDRILAPV